MVVAAVVFGLAYLVIVTEKLDRTAVALIGAGLLILFGVLSQEEAVQAVDFNTLGLLVGILTLCRPVAAFYFVPLAGCLFFVPELRVRARTIVPAFIVAALVLPAAWMARNAIHTGRPMLSTIGAISGESGSQNSFETASSRAWSFSRPNGRTISRRRMSRPSPPSTRKTVS